jgi:hypothetical protein
LRFAFKSATTEEAIPYLGLVGMIKPSDRLEEAKLSSTLFYNMQYENGIRALPPPQPNKYRASSGRNIRTFRLAMF